MKHSKTDLHGHLSNEADGVTLRDYFAALALPAAVTTELGTYSGIRVPFAEWVALTAYEYADAMLKVRAKK